VSVFLFVSRTAGVLTSDISERPSCSVVVVAQRHGSGFLIGGLIVPPALAPCTYLHIASDDAARSDPSSRGQIASLKQHRRLCGQGVWSNVTIPPYNIGDRLARGCVLLSDVAMRLGSCNPSADLAFLGCDAEAPVAGCRTRLWFGFWRCGSGRSGMLAPTTWVRVRFLLARFGLGPAWRKSRDHIASAGTFFFRGGGEGGGDETSFAATALYVRFRSRGVVWRETRG
jgi:hypothetical protein